MATHRVNQLDINLSRISDVATRDALASVVNFVNEMTQGIRTGGDVKGKAVSNKDGSAGFDKDGRCFARSINVERGGEFKIMVTSGELAALASNTIQLASGSKILGAFGWSQNNTTANWWPILDVNTSTAGNLINDVYIGAATIDSITLTSGDGNSANRFHLVIFYTDR